MGRHFDAIVIGAGQAGPPLAQRLAKAGKRVAVVERKLVGGTCVNAGCTPTKAMVASAYAAHKARTAAEYGAHCGEVRVNLAEVQARKDAIVAKSRTGLEESLEGLEGGALLRCAARFLSPTEVRVGDEVISAPQIFLNVGARPSIPKFASDSGVPFLTSTGMLALKDLPEHLIVVGGSYVGLEFAQMFRRFGAEVTVVERGKQLLSHADADTAAAVRSILENEGIQIRTGAECIHLHPGERGSVIVGTECTHGEPEIRGSHVLLAVGRTPNTDDLGIDAAGLKLNERGYIETDDQLRTSVPGIWAMGDCNGKGAFTHTSYNDYEIVAANLFDNDPRRESDRIACSAMYTDPPLAQVGMTESQVRATGRPAKMGLRLMTRVNRAVEKGETQGLMKVLVDAETEAILGATILGTGGDEAIHCILTAMYAKAPASLLRRSVHIHPTVSELIPTIFGELKPLE